MLIKKLRLKRGWSQEQLADLSGLSTRTIQRLERGANASLETLKSLASVFEINIAELSQHYLIETKEEPIMDANTQLNYEEAKAIEHVKNLKGFYTHALIFIIFLPILWVFNFIYSPNHLWAIWPTIGWSCGLAGHSTALFEYPIFSSQWEKKQIEKRLGRKL